MDLNCDLGESFGHYTIGNDEFIMDYVTSINIACGFHAGDPLIMDKTVKLAIDKGVKIGAHPGYPDVQGFGRRAMTMTTDEIKAMVIYQVGALKAFVEGYGGRLHHVKPHGALYNLAAKDEQVALSIIQGIKHVDESLVLYGLAGSKMIDVAKKEKLNYKQELFADRRYTDELKLVPRSEVGAVIKRLDESIEQCEGFIKRNQVRTIHGEVKAIEGETICIHGDHASGVLLAKALKAVMEEIHEN